MGNARGSTGARSALVLVENNWATCTSSPGAVPAPPAPQISRFLTQVNEAHWEGWAGPGHCFPRAAATCGRGKGEKVLVVALLSFLGGCVL